jgi:hypothetical protein
MCHYVWSRLDREDDESVSKIEFPVFAKKPNVGKKAPAVIKPAPIVLDFSLHLIKARFHSLSLCENNNRTCQKIKKNLCEEY